MRSPDPEIPSDELLYRRLKPEHIDGDRVLEDAIDGEGTSCDRARHRPEPRDLVSDAWPYVASIASGVVPTGLQPPGATGAPAVTWEFFVVDDPTEVNAAHTEIRVRRESRRPSLENDSAIKKRPHATRAWLKSQLAERFRVVTL